MVTETGPDSGGRGAGGSCHRVLGFISPFLRTQQTTLDKLAYIVCLYSYITALASATGGKPSPEGAGFAPGRGAKPPKKSWNEKSWKRSWNEKVVKRLASVVILNIYDYAKIAIFRYLKTHLNIDVDPPKLVPNILSWIGWSTKKIEVLSQTDFSE